MISTLKMKVARESNDQSVKNKGGEDNYADKIIPMYLYDCKNSTKFDSELLVRIVPDFDESKHPNKVQLALKGFTYNESLINEINKEFENKEIDYLDLQYSFVQTSSPFEPDPDTDENNIVILDKKWGSASFGIDGNTLSKFLQHFSRARKIFLRHLNLKSSNRFPTLQADYKIDEIAFCQCIDYEYSSKKTIIDLIVKICK